MPPPECVLLVGLPAAGKSTFYRRCLAGTHLHVSKDLMPRHARKAARQTDAIARALAAGQSVAIDNTQPTRADRAPVIAQARQLGARVIGYSFDVPVRICIGRNERREPPARVPKVAIFTAAKRWEAPALDEGFDAVCVVRVLDATRLHVHLTASRAG